MSSSILSSKEINQSTKKYPVDATQQQEDVIQWANDRLPLVGVLTEEKRGFVYLKVDDNYINQLFPMLSSPDYSKPPYFRRLDSPGAHISVFYVNERNQTGAIKEIGQKYSFKITGLVSVPPKTHEYIVLEVESSRFREVKTKIWAFTASPRA